MHDGDKQEFDWVDRWSLKVANAVKRAWPPTRETAATLGRRWGNLSTRGKQVSAAVMSGVLVLILLSFRGRGTTETPASDAAPVAPSTSPVPIAAPTTSTVNEDSPEISIVKAAVASRALVPRSAKFAPIEEWEVDPDDHSGGWDLTAYKGWVEVENKFGVATRSQFLAKVPKNGTSDHPGKIVVYHLQVDGFNLLGGRMVRTLDGRVRWTPKTGQPNKV